MFPFWFFVSIFPLFDINPEGDVVLLAGGVCVGRGWRHPRVSQLRNPCTDSGTERDGGAPCSARLIILVRRDRKYIITVSFNHFVIVFLLFTRVIYTLARLEYASLDSRGKINRLVLYDNKNDRLFRFLCSRV